MQRSGDNKMDDKYKKLMEECWKDVDFDYPPSMEDLARSIMAVELFKKRLAAGVYPEEVKQT